MSNNKSALIILGSPKQDGFTSRLLKTFLNLNSNIQDTIFINTYQRKIQPCLGCGFCNTVNECVYHDMDDIDRALKIVDVIIFATPVYNLSVPSPMKSFYDRMQRYYAAKFFRKEDPVLKKEKDGILIMTCGSNDEYGLEVVRRQTKLIASTINCKISKEIIKKGTDSYIQENKNF